MRSAKSVGRIVGILVLLQLASGLTLPFVLLNSAMGFPPGFLATAAENSSQIRAAVLLSFVGGALTVGIAIAAWPVIRHYSSTMALWFMTLCVISLSLDAVQNVTVLSMLSLSQDYVTATAADAELFQALGAVVGSTRRWAHYTQLLGFGGWIFLFYAVLWRFSLVPRALATLGLIGIMLQFAGVTLPQFLGYRSVMQMAMPLGPIHLVTAVWLIAKGFREGHPPFPAEDHGVTLSSTPRTGAQAVT